jgi:DNA mismatch endonuclease Vsr
MRTSRIDGPTMAQPGCARKTMPLPSFDDVPEGRRRVMACTRSFNTKPELAIRRGLHQLGYRYRIHDKRLPGRPDLSFPSRRVAVWVHGCFWHQHSSPTCGKGTKPNTRSDWWRQKLALNVARDAAAIIALEQAGWRCEVVWECEVNSDLRAVQVRLSRFLGPPRSAR